LHAQGGVPEWLKGTGCKPVGIAYVGSNPTPSTTVRRFARPGGQYRECGCSSMVELQPSKLVTRVRFPPPAPVIAAVRAVIVQPKQGNNANVATAKG
jgi:hypothetical protein